MAENLPDTNVGNIEYIRKQDAVDYCKALMNAELVQNTDDWGYGKERYNQTEVILEFIENRQPADVVPVVRCKNCKHHAYDEIFSCYWCEYPGRVSDTTPDGFCEKGEE